MEYLRIGLITRPHGVHGALKVQPLSEDLTRYKGLREAYLERGGAYEKVEVSDVSVQPDAVYMTISVCRDRNTAETLRNHYISVDREAAGGQIFRCRYDRLRGIRYKRRILRQAYRCA